MQLAFTFGGQSDEYPMKTHDEATDNNESFPLKNKRFSISDIHHFHSSNVHHMVFSKKPSKIKINY